jgi:putative transposase
MKYRFIDEHRDAHSVERMADVLDVTRSGYYLWRKQLKNPRKSQDLEVIEEIKVIQQEVKHIYGSPRLTKELKKRGRRINRKRVARLIATHGIGARRKKQFRITTKSIKGQWIAENLLNRQFAVSAANRAWVSDITYIATAEGWLYLSVVLDLYSRKVVGWAMNNRIDAQLLTVAYIMQYNLNTLGGDIHHEIERFSRCIDVSPSQSYRLA